MLRDERWSHGMTGWRVYVWEPRLEFGEVTGFAHDGHRVWVVIDGEEHPRCLRWEEVRPA